MNHEYSAETMAAADFTTKANEKARVGWRVISVIAHTPVGSVTEPHLSEITIFFERNTVSARDSIPGDDQSDDKNLMSNDEPAQVNELFEEGLEVKAEAKLKH
jgi:hypothetical protein